MSGELPHLDGVSSPHRRLLDSPLRPAAGRLIAAWYDLHIHGAELVPESGPLVMACNHIGIIDGPLLAIVGPRPVYALTKREMFHGPVGALLRAAGQVPVDRQRPDPRAIKTSLRLLADGGAMGLFPEGTRGAGDFARLTRGTAYLALASGAPVVPVVMFGTRLPGGRNASLPPRGTRIDVVFGEPVRWPRQAWPRTREQVDTVTELLQGTLVAHLDRARDLTGRSLPGPLPTDQGAP